MHSSTIVFLLIGALCLIQGNAARYYNDEALSEESLEERAQAKRDYPSMWTMK